MLWICLVVYTTSAWPAAISHGPMVGHTTADSTRIWVRADGKCELQVRLVPANGGAPLFSRKWPLVETMNFCGSVVVEGLAPRTEYQYAVLLDGVEQISTFTQTLTTFPNPKQRGVLRIGFGHSLTGPGDQTVWQAIGEKRPDLFILMGDNIYSDTTDPVRQRAMYLAFRNDPYFRAFGARTPIYAIYDDHDYGANNSDRTQPGKEVSIKTFYELWPNPRSEAGPARGIWTRFVAGPAEFFLMDVRYHRSPNEDPDGPEKTMLGTAQREWLVNAMADSKSTFKFPVSGSSWNCGGIESWNQQFAWEYDAILGALRRQRVAGIVLLGGDQHDCKICVRPRETWGGYDLHEWMAGQLWNKGPLERRGFGMITLDTTAATATVRLEFFDSTGRPHTRKRLPYVPAGTWRALWNSPPGVTGQKPPQSVDGIVRSSLGPFWEGLPDASGETLTETDLRF